MINDPNLDKWIEENVLVKYRKRGLLIWEDVPLDLVQKVRDAYLFGKESREEEDEEFITEANARIKGLQDALQAKNSTHVSVQQSHWPVIMLVLVLILIETFRHFVQ